ncbi:hypothetical protein SAMIE_1005020 [Sphingobium amiense]|uniref:SRPBCC family protein n=1 Tax=Sphingobium amiense TaxID=135719 RepID=A0A494VYP7_9SPHN|nr:hypothetical protein [Sphingobium amiense]BBD97001.1 hypothetical protein SAMIE_1005020 [Sphingobium amiense]
MAEHTSNTIDVAVVTCTVDIAMSVEDCWRCIRNFGDAGRFLNVPSQLISGDGGIGSVREIGDTILEAMVGQSDASYTYVQTEGPMAAYLYHGCVALSKRGPASCRLIYTITYNQASMSAATKEAERRRLSGRFQGAAEAMKRAVENDQRQ